MSGPKLPDKGKPRDEIISAMRDMRADDADWRSAKIWSLVYYAEDEIITLLKETYNMFFSENAANPMAFPSVRQFENEVIAMAADMLNGGPDVVGNMTSGGTESMLMVVLSSRERARAERPEITEPEILIPITAHPSFSKAAHTLNIKVVITPVGPDYRADVEAVRKAVNENTIMMAGSAPCFPYGVVDPIEELSEIARAQDIPFHVDSCLGGFMLPFVKKLGYDVPAFDFSVPGVTSISADIHKYGYGAKPASTITYRNNEYRKHQYYALADWPGGIYASTSMTGTKPGGAMAAAWAVMNYLGQEGYMRLAKITMDTTKKIIDGINSIPGLAVFGKPDMSVLGFGSDTLNVYALGDAMEERGWTLDRLQMPPGIHLIVMPSHAKTVDQFLVDLTAAAAEVEKLAPEDISGMAALYGMIGTLPDRNAAKEFVLAFLDDLYRIK